MKKNPIPLVDWNGNPIYQSPNPCVMRYGRGPVGTRCKTCAHLVQDDYHNKNYYKCELRKMTRGPGSDHRVSWEACKRYEEETEEGREVQA